MPLIKKPLNDLASICQTEIKWKKLHNLPSAKVDTIVKMAQEIFYEMEMGSITDIKYLIISKKEVSDKGIIELLRVIKKKGLLIREDTLEFNGPLQGYNAKTQVWSFQEKKYLIVNDDFANYIYTN